MHLENCKFIPASFSSVYLAALVRKFKNVLCFQPQENVAWLFACNRAFLLLSVPLICPRIVLQNAVTNAENVFAQNIKSRDILCKFRWHCAPISVNHI